MFRFVKPIKSDYCRPHTHTHTHVLKHTCLKLTILTILYLSISLGLSKILTQRVDLALLALQRLLDNDILLLQNDDVAAFNVQSLLQGSDRALDSALKKES